MKTSTLTILITCIMLSTSASAQGIKEFKAEEVKPFHADPVKPNSTKKEITKATVKADLNGLFGLFYYWVPGTSYTVPNYANNSSVLRTSAGTGVLPGSIRIDTNGTYIWNSSWDGKIIKGTWKLTGDAGFPIELVKGQEGKNWRVGKSTDEGASIYIADGSIWYNGKRVNGK